MQAAEDGPRFDAPEGVNWSPRRRVLVQGQVCSAPIVVARITAQQMEKMALSQDDHGAKQSRRIEPIARSQYPFCQGERAAVGRSRMPIVRIRLIKASPYTRSRSRNRYFGGFSQPIASVTCCAIHSAIGCAVTPNHRISLGHAAGSTGRTEAGRIASARQTDRALRSPQQCARQLEHTRKIRLHHSTKPAHLRRRQRPMSRSDMMPMTLPPGQAQCNWSAGER